jgi:hypothetical protein
MTILAWCSRKIGQVSKQTGVAVRVVFVGFAFALPVSADAPIGQYENFDSYNRYITDHYTKLVWERPVLPYPAAVKLSEAQAHCAQLGAYRLPSLKELLTLVDEEPHPEYEESEGRNVPRYIDRSAFPKTPAEPFWTSSMKDASYAWTVNFETGETDPVFVANTTARVRCVAYRP